MATKMDHDASPYNQRITHLLKVPSLPLQNQTQILATPLQARDTNNKHRNHIRDLRQDCQGQGKDMEATLRITKIKSRDPHQIRMYQEVRGRVKVRRVS